jgi:acetolactate synthase-1/3 small subunit
MGSVHLVGLRCVTDAGAAAGATRQGWKAFFGQWFIGSRRHRSAGRLIVRGKRHIISVTLQNEVGALTRVAGLFSTRGYNIESLSVAPTDDPAVSRLTLVTTGNDAVIQQISNQLLKLIDVVDVEDITREEHFERELLLVKVKAKATQVGRLWSATQKAGGRVLWDAADSFTIELTSNEAEINRFIAEISSFGELLEVVRSGALAIQKGKEILES